MPSEPDLNQPVPDPTEEAAHEANLFLAIFSAVVILIVGLLITHLLHTGCACEVPRSPAAPAPAAANGDSLPSSQHMDTHDRSRMSPVSRSLPWYKRTCTSIKRIISSIPEACALILLGFTLGAFLYLIPSTDFDEILENLNESFGKLFFVMLLPPVIFESGYSMDKVCVNHMALDHKCSSPFSSHTCQPTSLTEILLYQLYIHFTISITRYSHIMHCSCYRCMDWWWHWYSLWV